MRAAVGPLVLLVFASAAWGHAVDRRVEVREFELPGGPTDPAMNQVREAQDGLSVDAPQQTDRSIAIPQARSVDGVTIAQVPRSLAPVTSAQITEGDPRAIDPRSLSSRDQSAPGTTTRLGGTDRCDPQTERARDGDCLRILERRAGEFAAPAAPSLSAEEVLLAQRRVDDEDVGKMTIDQRLRRASQTDPDADLSSNQELASLLLPGGPQQPLEPTQDNATLRAAEIDAVLRAIGIPVQPRP